MPKLDIDLQTMNPFYHLTTKTGLVLLIYLFVAVNGFARNNPCGIQARFTNQQDTIITGNLYQVNFENTSSGATSFKWLYNGLQYFYGPTQPSVFNFSVNSTTGVGMHKIQLAISNGICNDTASVVIIITGTQGPTTLKSFSSILSVFSKNFNETFSHTITDFIKVDAKNYVLAGEYVTYANGNTLPKNGFLIKISDSACVQWSKKLGPNSSIRSLKSCKNGDILAVSNWGNQSADPGLIKISSDGQLKWSLTLSNMIRPTESSPLNLISEDENENIYIAANSNDYKSSGNSISEQKIIKIDKTGSIIWSKIFRRKYEYPYGTGVIAKNLLVSGNDVYISGVLSVDASYRLESYITKLNALTGNEIWSKRYVSNPSVNFLLNELHVAGDKLLVNFNTNSILGSTTVIPVYSYFNTDGVPLQSYQINITDFSLTSPYNFKIVPIPDGGFYYSIFGNESLALQPGFMYYSIFAKISALNNIEWQWKFGNYNRDYYKHIAIGENNSLLAAGAGLVSSYKYYPSEVLRYAKIESNGNLNASCDFTKSNYTTQPIVVNSNTFSWVEDSTVSYFVTNPKDASLQHINIIKKWLCPNYIDSCSYISIDGENRVCDLSKNYTYTINSLGSCNFTVINPTEVSLIDKTDSSITVSFNTPGVHTLKVEKTTGCSKIVDSIIVTAKPLAYNFTLGPDTAVCSGSRIKLNAGNKFLRYFWQDGSTDSIFYVTSPGKYYVTVIDSCYRPVSDTVNVTLASLAYIDFMPNYSLCLGDSAILQAKTGYTNYTWEQKSYSTQLDTAKLKIKPTTSYTYLVSAVDVNGCVIKDSAHIVVNPLPKTLLPKDTTLCEGTNLRLETNPNLKNYLWSTGNIGTSINITGNGKYWLTIEDMQGCKQRDTTIVSFQPLPRFSLGKDTTLCEDQSHQLKTDSVGTYLWQDGSSNNNYTVRSAGVYWLKINRGSCTYTDSINISYQERPKFNFPNDTILCDNKSLLVDVSQASNTATYEWQDASIQSTYTIKQAGKYSVIVKAYGCYTTDTAIVDYQPTPVHFTKDTTKCIEDTIVFDATTKGASYLWQDFSRNPTMTITRPGNYRCVVNNYCGTGSTTVLVSDMVCDCDIIAPNIFSPNGDGINDVFRISTGCQLSFFDMQIFNREGQVIFRSSNISKEWNGTFNGKTIPVGTYYYLIKIKGQFDMIPKQKSGSITLVR